MSCIFSYILKATLLVTCDFLNQTNYREISKNHIVYNVEAEASSESEATSNAQIHALNDVLEQLFPVKVAIQQM